MGEKKSFWSTLPGILTGLAMLISAIGGLLVTLYQIDVLPISKDRVPVRQIVEEKDVPKESTTPRPSYPSIQLLMKKIWQFRGGSDGSMIIADRIRLLPGGGIDGYYHPNEARWGIEHGILVFYTERGEPSCRFDTVDRKDGRIILSGHFLLEPGLIDVLREVQ